jgi:pimeloyl-ACP methyl ester carboxylesterase
MALFVTLSAITPLLTQSVDLGSPPGRLVDIGGRKIHMICTGNGSPTVILEAGASAFAIDWTLVQGELARTNRVCSYDRAGSGFSDPATGGPGGGVIADLHAALQAAGEKPPYVMVGASMGGIYVRLYQAQYPDEVVTRSPTTSRLAPLAGRRSPCITCCPIRRASRITRNSPTSTRRGRCRRSFQTPWTTSERPWSPTGVAVSGEDVYVLEYTHAHANADKGWRPRVRKLGRDGKVTTLATIPARELEGRPK